MIPKILHQIWVGPYDIPSRDLNFINQIKEGHPKYQHILWKNENLPELPSNIQELMDIFEKQEDYAHQADILRTFLVSKFGGIYLDVDFKLINGFEGTDIDNFDGFFCYHGHNDYTMPNGIMGSKKEGDLINFILDDINIKKGIWYGPSWLGGVVKKYYGLDYETNHEITSEILFRNNIKYMPFSYLESNIVKHLALYSWSPENKNNFKNGNINYLK